jgi:hypothetical protein
MMLYVSPNVISDWRKSYGIYICKMSKMWRRVNVAKG